MKVASSVWEDLRKGFFNVDLWWMLATQDIRQRYRRSMIGPFWITITMIVVIAGLGPLYARLFNMAAADYVPNLAAGLIAWSLISGGLTEASNAFISSENLIKSTGAPLTVHVLRATTRSLLLFAHNLAALIPFLLIYQVNPGWELLLLPIGLLILTVFIVSSGYLLGTFCARFRDMQQIILNILQFAFFLTPIIWKPGALSGRVMIVEANPFFWLIEIIRAPMLGYAAKPLYYFNAIALTTVVTVVGLFMFARFRRRVAYWV
ncbi:ABC transporter permease [Lysobacter sp. CA196]|uniref:ABC transporter permease n=1 Tax=Lysobacter sp. CA196 TaxID=3455606 RepID=UPI003F8D20AE